MMYNYLPLVIFYPISILGAFVLRKYNKKKFLLYAMLTWLFMAVLLHHQMGAPSGIKNIIVLSIAVAAPCWLCFITILLLKEKNIPFYVSASISYLIGLVLVPTVEIVAFFAAVFVSIITGDV